MFKTAYCLSLVIFLQQSVKRKKEKEACYSRIAELQSAQHFETVARISLAKTIVSDETVLLYITNE